MPLVVLSVGLVATPLEIQVVVAGSATPLVRAAEELRLALEADGRLAVAGAVLSGVATGPDGGIAEAAALIARAHEAYAELDPEAALDHLTRAQEILRPRLDRDDAAGELADSLRLAGLTHLFVEKPAEAAQSFVSAHFLDPDYSPGAGQWPPEARLAYADAIAAARGAPTGSLSIRVEPEVAEAHIDGRSVGLGSTTVRDFAPGAHHLLVTCPGYKPFAAVVNVEGRGTLNQASVFLEARPRARELAVAALAGVFGGDTESTAARQAAAVTGAGALVLVVDDAGRRRTVAWLLDSDGARRGGSMDLARKPETAAEIASRLKGGELLPPAIAPADPWYLRWHTLAAAGAVVLGGAVALVVALNRDSTERVSFHFGNPP